MVHTTVFLPGKSHELRNLAGCSPGGCKESDMTEQLSMHAHITDDITVNSTPKQRVHPFSLNVNRLFSQFCHPWVFHTSA